MPKNVIVVDDPAVIHQMHEMVLSRCECTIMAAKNGQEALDMIFNPANFTR